MNKGKLNEEQLAVKTYFIYLKKDEGCCRKKIYRVTSLILMC